MKSLKRKLAAAKALDLGWGGISTVARVSGMSITTIRKGIQELENLENFGQTKRIRTLTQHHLGDMSHQIPP